MTQDHLEKKIRRTGRFTGLFKGFALTITSAFALYLIGHFTASGFHHTMLKEHVTQHLATYQRHYEQDKDVNLDPFVVHFDPSLPRHKGGTCTQDTITINSLYPFTFSEDNSFTTFFLGKGGPLEETLSHEFTHRYHFQVIDRLQGKQPFEAHDSLLSIRDRLLFEGLAEYGEKRLPKSTPFSEPRYAHLLATHYLLFDRFERQPDVSAFCYTTSHSFVNLVSYRTQFSFKELTEAFVRNPPTYQQMKKPTLYIDTLLHRTKSSSKKTHEK